MTALLSSIAAAVIAFGAGWIVGSRQAIRKRQARVLIGVQSADFSWPGQPMRVIDAEFETVSRLAKGAGQ